MTDKLELKSCHEVIDTVDVVNIESIFYGKPTDPDILTVAMKDGKKIYCDEVCPVDSLQEEHKLKPKFQEGNKIVYVGERKELDTDEHTILYVYDDMYVTTCGKKIPFKFQDDYQLVEEPVSIWHDASEKPEYDDLLIETNDGRIIHRQSINNYGMVKRWAYCKDILNLSNVERTGKDWKEEPVSGDLGEYINKLSKQFPEVSFAKLSRIAVRVAKWQKKKDQKK